MKKKLLAKKTLSVLLAVLMLMSAWVFVPGEHHIEAEAALAYGMSAVNGASEQNKTFLDRRTDSTGDYVQIKYPGEMYMDISENLSDTGYSVNLSTSFGSGSNYKLVMLPTLWGGQQFTDEGGTFGTADLKGQTNIVDNFTNFGIQNGSLPGYFDNYAVDGNNIAVTCGDPYNNIGTSGFNAPFIGQPKAVGTYTYDMSKANGTPTTAKYIKSGSGGYTGTSWANDNYEDGTPTNFKIIVYDKSALNTAINTAGSYTSQTSKYTADSLNTLKTAVSSGQTVLTTRKVTQSAINTAEANINNAINNLVVARNFDITYENMFSLTDWMNTDSYVYTYQTDKVIDIEDNNTLRIYKSSAGNEVTTGSSYPNNHSESRYSIPVTGGVEYTVRYEIAETSSVSGTAQSEVFMFWYDANNNPVQSTTSTNTFDHKGFSSKGVCSVNFTAPANAAKAEIRFDNDCPSSGCTLRFQNIAVYPADRGTEQELASWTVRPYRKVFGYHVTLSGKLDVPERKGYAFNGWYLDNVNINGQMDDGEAITDAQGNVIKELTMNKHYNLYADWKPLPMDIGYDNLFSLAEWAKSGSAIITGSGSADASLEYDVMNGTVTVETNSTLSNPEAYTNYSGAGNTYRVAVEAGKDYVFETDMKLEKGTKGQMFVFFYNESGAGVTGAHWYEQNRDETVSHIGIYPTTEGAHTITFKVPEGCTQIGFRVGATATGTRATYSNIGVYEKAVYDAYAKDYAVVRVPFNFGDTTNLSLVPTRAGYKFDGWYTADGTKLTSVDGLKESTIVYAQWIQLYTVTFKNWNGEVVRTVEVAPGAAATAPADPAKAPDDDYEYVFDGWDIDFSNVQSDLTVTATFTTKAHSNIVYNKITNATCTTPGTITKVCNDCNYVWNNGTPFEDTTGEFAPALGHTFDEANPTYTVITDKGTEANHTVKCNRCDATTTMDHDFKLDADHPASDATCVKAGETYYKCACHREKTETGTINSNNHVNTRTINYAEAECEKPGYTGDTYCDDCQKTVATGSATEALEHVYTNYVYNNDATCTADGTKTAKCDNRCGKEDKVTAEGTKISHSFTNYVSNNDATCEADGTKTAKCDYNCGAENKVTDEGSKRQHIFEGAVKNNGDGTHSFECSYDDCTAYGGTVACSTWKENAAEGKCECTVCGYTKDHKWGKWSQAEGNTGDAAGKMVRECADCKATDETDCTYTSDKTEATCDDDAYTTYECTDADCGHGYTVIEKGTATGHKFGGAYRFDAENDKHQQACTNKDCTAYGVGADKDAWADCTWTYVNKEAGKHTASCVCGNSEEQACTGGTATCTAPAECQFCNTAYGTTADHVYTGTEKYLFKATDATCIANETYYKYCIGCEKFHSDETYEKPDTMTAHVYTCTDEYLYIATQAKCGVNETYYAYCSNPDCKKSSEDANNTFEKGGTALEHNWVNAQYNGEDTLTHTFTCDNTNADGWVCNEKMTANCADSAITFGLEEATCTEQGYTTVQCTACNHTWNIDYTDALGHDYTEKIYDEAHLKEAANCEHENIYYYDCSRCDHSAKDIAEGEVYTGQATYRSGEIRDHEWITTRTDEEYLLAEATCFAAAKYYKSCKYDDCKKSAAVVLGEDTKEIFSYGSPLDHDWKEVEVARYLATEADCVNDATYYYECSHCKNSSKDYDNGSTWAKENSKSGHDFDHDNDGVIGNEGDTGYAAEKAATCYEAGNYEYWYCSTCKKYFKDADANEAYLGQSATVIKKREHDIEKVAYKAPSCEQEGHPAYEYCKYDDCSYTTLKETYKATGHNFTGAYTYDTVFNYHSKLCLNGCGKNGMVVDGEQVEWKVTYNEDDEAVIAGGEKCNFTYKAETKDGVHSHANACVCGNNSTKIYSDEETFVKKVAPTCTEKGYDSYKCPDEECGKTWTKNEVSALGHTAAEKATSNGDGTHSVYCTVDGCGYKISTEKCSGGTATCKDKAVCSVCEAAYGETTGHTYTTEWAYQNDAKCGVNGTEKNTCSVCQTVETREAEGTALKHAMTDYGYAVPEKLAATLAEKGIVIKAPTCKEEGLALSYCSNCEYYQTKIQAKDTSSHVWEKGADGELVWTTVGGDCATGVTLKNVCTVCGKSQTKTEEGSHTWVLNFHSEPTCVDKGYRIWKCSTCDFTLNEHYGYNGELPEGYSNDQLAPLGEAGHKFVDTGAVKAATCTEPAKRIEKCLNCDAENYVNAEGSEALGHALVNVEADEADCVYEGNIEHWICGRCKTMFADEAGTEVITSVVVPVKAHADNDGDGKCDECYRVLYSNDDGEGSCGCICHKDNFLMKILYKIVNFFWKLFKISKSCECGAVHW